jgi:hypothetical protein
MKNTVGNDSRSLYIVYIYLFHCSKNVSPCCYYRLMLTYPSEYRSNDVEVGVEVYGSMI